MQTSAVDAITAAFAHTRRYLFAPFRWGQWVRLAVVGALSGEMGGGGSTGLRLPAHVLSSFPGPQPHQLTQAPRVFGNLPQEMVWVVIASVIAAGLALWLLFTYVYSRMRFVLFDSVVARDCRIRQYWRQRGAPAFGYFVWQLLMTGLMLLATGLVLAPPLALALVGGWFEDPGAHLLPMLLTGLAVMMVLVAEVLAFFFVIVLVKDFVVPQMALEGVTVWEGWTRLWALMKADKTSYAAYLVLKIVLTIAAMVVYGIVGFVLVLIVMIPVGGVGLAAVLGGQAVGLMWNALTIAVVAVVGLSVLLALIFLFALISVPLVVFFPAYSYHFFAGRYPPLQAALTSQG